MYVITSPECFSQTSEYSKLKKGSVLRSKIREFTCPYIFTATVISLITRCKWRLKQES